MFRAIVWIDAPEADDIRYRLICASNSEEETRADAIKWCQDRDHHTGIWNILVVQTVGGPSERPIRVQSGKVL